MFRAGCKNELSRPQITRLGLKTISCLLSLATPLLAAPVDIRIDPKPSHDVPCTLNGLFFEDINYGVDGGLYADWVANWK